MNTKLLFALAFLCLFSSIYGQTFTKQDAEKIVSGSKTVKINSKDKTIRFIQLDEKQKMVMSNQENWLKQSLRFSKNHGLKQVSKDSDKLGFTHTKFQVKFKDIPVEGAVYTVHTKAGSILSANGEYSLGKDVNVSPEITEKDAFLKAKDFVNADQYKWGTNLDARPKGELVILPQDSIYILTWKFDIYALNPFSRQYIFIDAKTGKVVKTINRIINADTNGTAVTLYSGTVSITTDSYGGSFRLRESNRGSGIETYDLNNGSDHYSAVDFTDADNYWDNNVNNDKAALDAHFGAEATYDYYFNNFGRNSFDNNGTKLISYVHYGSNYVNAFWDGSCMTYGDGDGVTYGPLTPIEVVAHELTHGVTEYTAGLIYSGESGALNESFSDIFGIVVDFIENPTTANYQMGDAMSPSHTPFRSMSNPNEYGNPDTYLGLYWDPYEEVHTNSGVMNYWFYLLSEGGNGTNDIGNSFSVSGIGREKAAQIAYRNLSVYLTPSSNYADAREYAIQSAIDLFGECSDEVVAVTNAWYAVGVGNEFDGAILADFSTSSTSVCNLNTNVHLYNHSRKATSYEWNFGDGNNSTEDSPTHIYSIPGTYTVKLLANGIASCANVDSSEITINVTSSNVSSSTCEPLSINPGTGGIYRFVLNTIDNSSAGSSENYQDYTCSQSTEITEGKFYNLIVKVGDDKSENIRIWLDKNKDSSFTSNELIFSADKVSKELNTSILIPGSTVYNTPLRLRVFSDYSEYSPVDACSNSNNGQIEDYSVIVKQNTASPASNFSCGKTDVMVGDTIRFRDLSLNLPTSWNWSFPGGEPLVSTEQNPKVVYKHTGTYNVSLVATNNYGTDSLGLQNYIAATIPIPEGFKASITDNVNGVVSLNWFEDGNTILEDFSDGIADRFIFIDPEFSVSDGMLKAYSLGNDSWSEAYVDKTFDNFSMEYKFRREAGSSNSSIATLIRSNGTIDSMNCNGYLICTNSSGRYSIWKMQNGNVSAIIPWSSSSAISTTPGEWNVVTIEAFEDSVRLFINGIFVNGFIDGTYSNGRVGFAAYMQSGNTQDVRWDDVKIIPGESSTLKMKNIAKAINLPIGGGSSTSSPEINYKNKFIKPLSLLPSISQLKDSSLRYNVFRDNVLLKTVADIKCTDTLATAGNYTYHISLKTTEDESLPSNKSSVFWYGNPVISVNPTSFNEEVLQGDSITKQLVIKNTGNGILKYNIEIKNDTVATFNFNTKILNSVKVKGLINNTLKNIQNSEIEQVTKEIVEENSINTTQNILVYEKTGVQNYYDDALNNLGLSRTFTNSESNFENLLSNGTKWDLILVNSYSVGFQTSVLDKIENARLQGSKIVFADWSVFNYKNHPLLNGFGVHFISDITTPEKFEAIDANHSIFSSPNNVRVFQWSDNQGDRDGQLVEPINSATNLAEYDLNPGKGSIVLNAENTCLFNAFQAANFNNDDNSNGKKDIIELIENEVSFLLGNNKTWLNISEVTDTLLSGESDTIDVKFNSKELEGNRYLKNLQITSTDNIKPVTNVNCIFNVLSAPTAKFISSKRISAKGQSISFYNKSTGGSTSVKWIFEGGSIDTSLLDNPVVLYNSIGSFDVKLIVENSLGSDTLVMSDYITITNLVYCKSNLGGGGCPGDISNVTFTGTSLNNSEHSNCTSTDNSTYGSFEPIGNKTTELIIGKTYELSVTTTRNSIISAWIDYNQNGIFEAEEWTQVTTSSSSGIASKVSIKVPLTANVGVTGLRIRTRSSGSSNGASDACSEFFSGITEDYAITLKHNIPAVPVANFTAPTMVLVGTSVDFEDATSGVPTSWKWKFEGGTPSTSTLQFPKVVYNTVGKYDVKLVVSNDLGIDSVTKSDFITITTEKPGESCSSALDLSQLTSPYNGSTVDYKNDFSYCNNRANDMIFFADILPGDSLIIGQSSNDYDSRHTLRVGGACPGTTEVLCVDDPDIQQHIYVNNTSSQQRVYWIQAGYSSNYGSFTLEWRLSHESCPNPKDLKTDSVAFNYASISWTPGRFGTSWDIEWGPQGFSRGSGTYITSLDTNFLELSGLDLGTYYDVYIRSNCAVDDKSAWKLFSFSTLNLDPPSNVLVKLTNPENGSVELSWDKPSSGINENFDDGTAQNWIPVKGNWEVANGTFNTKVSNMESTQSAYYDTDFSNYTFEVKVRKVDYRSSYIGVFLNGDPSTLNVYEDWAKGYVFYYSNDYWSIFKNDDGKYTIFQSGYSSAIKDIPGEWNSIKVSRSSNGFIRIDINGSNLGTFYDTRFISGKVGLKCYANGGQVEFDDIKLSPLASGFTFGKVSQPVVRDMVKDVYSKNAEVINTVFAPIPPVESYVYNASEPDVNYSVYRNSVKVGTTSSLTYTETLPAYGDYNYQISAVYSAGESDLTNAENVVWYGNPAISLSQLSFSDTIDVGVVLVKPLQIKNTGNGKLIVSLEATVEDNAANPWLVLEGTQDTLENGEELVTTVNVFASKVGVGDYSGKIIVRSNDWAQPLIEIPYKIKAISKPIADFNAFTTTIVKDNSVQFYGLSRGNPDSLIWIFPGGNPSVSTEKNPTVFYSNAGVYDVSLIVKNALGIDTLTRTNYIHVNRPPYCKNSLGGSHYCPGDISYVSFTGTSFNNFNHDSCIYYYNYYSSYGSYAPVNGTTTDLRKGLSYELQVVTKKEDIVSVWIDYNQNSEFEASEWTQVSTSSKINIASKVSILIPKTALNGQTGMRIRTRFTGYLNGANNACSSFWDGEGITEDYTVTIIDAIDPAFSVNDTSVCPNDTVMFTNISEGNADSFLWNFGDGAIPATATSAGPHKVVYNTSGNKTVTLTVNDSISITKRNYVKVNSVPTSFLIEKPTPYCKGFSGKIALSNSHIGDLYSLFKNGNLTSISKNGTGNSLVWEGVTAGNYSIIGQNVETTCSSVMSNNVTLSEIPISSISINAAICSGEKYKLPDGTYADKTGIYTTHLSSVSSCDSIVTTNLTELPAFSINKTASICFGAKYQLPNGQMADTSGMYSSLLKSVSGCDSIVNTRLTVSPMFDVLEKKSICQGESYLLPSGLSVRKSGEYSSILKSVAGCDSSITTILDVTQLPTVSAGADQSICQGSSITLLASGLGQIVWKGYIGNPIEATPSKSTIYKVSATNNCGEATDEVFVTIVPVPLKPNVTMSGKELISNYSFGNQWYSFKSGLLGEAVNQSYTPEKVDKYFTIVTRDGCLSDTSNIIDVQNVGIYDVANEDLVEGFPVPVENIFSLESKVKMQSVTVLDAIGNILYKNTAIECVKYQIDMAAYKPGVYSVVITLKEKNLAPVIKKISKR